jgi:GAF domain-containing protein
MENYQGWTNRESWATALWIDNDEGLILAALDYARQLNPLNRNDLADTLEGWITDELLTRENVAANADLWLMLTDIGSLYRVNWRELADHYLSQVNEQVA